MSSRSRGVRNRGVIRNGPRTPATRSASRATASDRLGRHFLEKADGDLAVLALRPSSDNPPLPPHRRAGVTAPVEQPRAVIAEVPGTLRPPHRRWVEGGEAARPMARLEAPARHHRPASARDRCRGSPPPDRAHREPLPCFGPTIPSTSGGRRGAPDRMRPASDAPVRSWPRLPQSLGSLLVSRSRSVPTGTRVLNQVPRGRPRMIRPSALSRKSTCVDIPIFPA